MQQLLAIKNSLNEDEKQKIINQSMELAQRQLEEDDPGVLPKVGLSDVPETITEPQRLKSKLANSSLPVNFYGQGTNGLCYQQVVMQLPELAPQLLDILPLYTSCLTELGIADKDYSEVQAWQAQVSGGINCFSSIRSNLDDVQKIKSVIAFSSKCLADKHSALSELMHETIHNVRFDESQRLSDLIEQICARKENSITGQGHSLAMSLASSRMSPTAQLAHNFTGLEGIQRLKAIRQQLQTEQPRQDLLNKFQQIHDLVLAANKEFLLIAEPEKQQHVSQEIDALWQGQADSPSSSSLSLPSIRESICQAWTTSTQVNFCAKAYPTVPASHEDNATLQVLAGFMRNGFLHRSIREQGGAYGGGASQDSNSASFRFFSYRDPRLQETLDDFDRATDWVISNKHQAHQLEEAILGVIASMDKPASPAGEAKHAYYNHLFGRTLDHRMTFRKRVLNTSLDDLKAVADRYLKPEQASIGIITNREAGEALETSNLELINL